MPQTDELMAGMRILELGQGIAGSVLGKLLREHGADVTKVPLGNRSAPGVELETAFEIWDLGKTVELLVDPAKLADLVVAADVIIDQSWCRGRNTEGLTEALRQRNDAAILCTIESGLPFSVEDLSAWDLEGLVSARAGMYESLGQVNGQIVETVAYVDIPVASICTAIQAMVACSAAILRKATVSGRCDLRLSLSTAPVYAKGIQFIQTDYGDGIIPDPSMGLSGLYQGGDGRWMILSVPSHRLAGRLLKTLHRAEWMVDGLDPLDKLMASLTPEEVATTRARMQEIFSGQPAEYWESLISEAGVPCVVCRSASEWLDTKQALDIGILRDVELRNNVRARAVGPVVSVT